MGILKLFKKKEKESLRDYCLNKYGKEFVEKYDILGTGGVIGDFYDTIWFLWEVESARIEWQRKYGIEV